jgi:hypothetical protein
MLYYEGHRTQGILRLEREIRAANLYIYLQRDLYVYNFISIYSYIVVHLYAQSISISVYKNV